MLAALFAAGLAANGLAGTPPLLNLGYSLVNIADILMAMVVVRRLGLPRYFPIGRGAVFGLAAGVAAGAGRRHAGRRRGLAAWRRGRDRGGAQLVLRQPAGLSHPVPLRHGGVLAAIRQAEFAHAASPKR